MKVYEVHLKNKDTKTYIAHSYTEKDGKYFFHKKEDQTDHDSFVLESEIVGIDYVGDEDDEPPSPVFG